MPTQIISPKDYHSLVSYQIYKDVKKAIEFYEKVFNAKLILKLEYNNRINHAEIMIGDSKIMLGEENKSMGLVSAVDLGNTPIIQVIFVDNVDEIFKNIINQGGKAYSYPKDQYYGIRNASIIDPFGFKWDICQPIEAVNIKEMQARHEKFMGKINQNGGDYLDKKYIKFK